MDRTLRWPSKRNLTLVDIESYVNSHFLRENLISNSEDRWTHLIGLSSRPFNRSSSFFSLVLMALSMQKCNCIPMCCITLCIDRHWLRHVRHLVYNQHLLQHDPGMDHLLRVLQLHQPPALGRLRQLVEHGRSATAGSGAAETPTDWRLRTDDPTVD